MWFIYKNYVNSQRYIILPETKNQKPTVPPRGPNSKFGFEIQKVDILFLNKEISTFLCKYKWENYFAQQRVYDECPNIIGTLAIMNYETLCN